MSIFHSQVFFKVNFPAPDYLPFFPSSESSISFSFFRFCLGIFGVGTKLHKFPSMLPCSKRVLKRTVLNFLTFFPLYTELLFLLLLANALFRLANKSRLQNFFFSCFLFFPNIFFAELITLSELHPLLSRDNRTSTNEKYQNITFGAVGGHKTAMTHEASELLDVCWQDQNFISSFISLRRKYLLLPDIWQRNKAGPLGLLSTIKFHFCAYINRCSFSLGLFLELLGPQFARPTEETDLS